MVSLSFNFHFVVHYYALSSTVCVLCCYGLHVLLNVYYSLLWLYIRHTTPHTTNTAHDRTLLSTTPFVVIVWVLICSFFLLYIIFFSSFFVCFSFVCPCVSQPVKPHLHFVYASSKLTFLLVLFCSYLLVLCCTDTHRAYIECVFQCRQFYFPLN